MKIAIGCDPNAQAAKEALMAYMTKKGYGEITDFMQTSRFALVKRSLRASMIAAC